MINTGLDRKYKASASAGMDFSPVPDGEYKLFIKEITPWKAQTKDIKVILRDEDGKAIKNEKGENETEMVKDCEFYNCMVKLEIVGGEYAGRLIFHNLSTHPNMPFAIPNFLYGVGMEEISAGEIQTKCLHRTCLADVTTHEYTTTKQNKETGIDEEVVRKSNNIKSFKAYQEDDVFAEYTPDELASTLDDMGI